MIKFSAPGKIHLLGEHAVVYGKPALLSAINLRVKVTLGKKTDENFSFLRKVVNNLIAEKFKVKKIPDYSIESSIPAGSGMGFSAAGSAAIIATLLTYFKIKWGKKLINELTFEAEKVFHGNPSGGDNSTVVYGGLIWFRKESPNLKIIQLLPFTIPPKLSKNFILINTGKPKETTKDMVVKVKSLYDKKPELVKKFLEDQERLVRELLVALKDGEEKEVIRIIREGEKNLESIGVCSSEVKKIIRQIEKVGGAAKICGAGLDSGPTGVLLCYHKNSTAAEKIAKAYNLAYFTPTLGVEGLRQEWI